MSIKQLQNCGFYKTEILSLLNQLTYTPEINSIVYNTIICNLDNNHNHNIFVYSIDDKPVGMITLFIEQKLIHGGLCVGHIEDLIIDKDYRNQNIARKLIDHVINIATYNKCYKIILDCDESLIPFYEKCGFHKKAVQMRMDL